MARPLQFTPVKAPVTEEQRKFAYDSPLYRKGDMVLIWVNEGDLIEAMLTGQVERVE